MSVSRLNDCADGAIRPRRGVSAGTSARVCHSAGRVAVPRGRSFRARRPSFLPVPVKFRSAVGRVSVSRSDSVGRIPQNGDQPRTVSHVADQVGIAASAVAIFAATNIDDIVVLTVLFVTSRTAGRPRPWQIVVGQYAGIGVLVAASLAVAAGLLVVPDPWTGLRAASG